MPNNAMDQNVSLERVMRVKTCLHCGVPQTFISRLRKDRCAVCALGLRLVRSDAEVELLRRFARDLWSMRSIQPQDVVIPAGSSWREKIEAWLATKPAIVTIDAALQAVDVDPASTTDTLRARARATLRDLGQAVKRVKYRAPPQGVLDVSKALQRLGKAEVTIDELLPPEARGDRRRIKIVARALAYLGWKGARSSIGQGKRALLYAAPAEPGANCYTRRGEEGD